KKLGQPEPLSYFVSERKSGVSQQTQTNVPARFSSSQGPVKGRSVAEQRVISYCSGVSFLRHSSSFFGRLSVVMSPPALCSADVSIWREYGWQRPPGQAGRPIVDYSKISVIVSATIAGRSWPSISIVTSLMSWVPPALGAASFSVTRQRTREPTGTMLVKRTEFEP